MLVISSEYSNRDDPDDADDDATARAGSRREGARRCAIVAFVTRLITCFASFFLGQAIMSSHHISASLSQPNVLRAVIGGALFLTACGAVLAFGLGLLLRHTAGAITTVVGLLFVVTILVNFLPSSWQNHVDKWMPADAGTQIWATIPSQGQPPFFAPWTGFAVLGGYAAIALIAGLILFRKRDALKSACRRSGRAWGRLLLSGDAGESACEGVAPQRISSCHQTRSFRGHFSIWA